MNTKREKCLNMQEAVKDALIKIVLKYTHIVENKKTDGVFAKAKRDCWRNEIAKEFNSSGVRYKRTVEQLHGICNNMKYRLKKDIAADRAGVFKTGGGEYHKLVDENNLLLQVVNKETTPLTNEFDSSATYWEDFDVADDFAGDIIEINYEKFSISSASTSTKDTTTETDSFLPTTMFTSASPTRSAENHSCQRPSALVTATPQKKKKLNNESLRLFAPEYADLKKTKYEAQIEESMARKEMYKERTELLRLQKIELNKKIEKENNNNCL